MRQAGVQIVSLFSIVCDLMRDWRNTPGVLEVLPYLNKYYPAYGQIAKSHLGAIENGTANEGQLALDEELSNPPVK
jgi:hypothetical protein